MSTLKSALVDWLVYGNVIIGLAAVGVVFTISVFLGMMAPFELLLVVFLITMSSYNINRFMEQAEEDTVNHPRRSAFFSNNQSFFAFNVLLILAVMVLAFFYKGFNGLFIVAIFPLSVLAYSAKWIPHKYSRVKEIPVMKNLFPTTIWALAPILCVVWLSAPVGPSLLASFVFVFLRLLIGVIAFDVRDVRGDRAYRINTLPVLLGIEDTKIFLLLLNTLSGLFLFVSVSEGWLPPAANAVNLITLYGYYFIFSLSEKAPLYLYDIIIDGEYFLWAPLAFIGTIVF